MSNVIFSSWTGEIVDNRGQKQTSVENLKIPLQYDGRKVKAFMSWNGLVVADESVDVVDMAYSYLKEVEKLSCGECSVGYLGIKVMTDIFNRILNGKGTEEDIGLLKRLGNGIKGNTRCDFCDLAVTPVVDTLNYYEEE